MARSSAFSVVVDLSVPLSKSQTLQFEQVFPAQRLPLCLGQEQQFVALANPHFVTLNAPKARRSAEEYQAKIAHRDPAPITVDGIHLQPCHGYSVF